MENPSKNKVPLLLVAILGFSLRLFQLGRQSLWFDETYTVFVARAPFPVGWQYLVADGVHPPLFYWLQKVALVFGESEFAVRLPAALFGALTVPVLYLFSKHWIGERRALLGSLLLALSPFHIWFSQDARMYSALALLAVLCMGLYARLLRGAGRAVQVGFILSSAAAYAVHYFALLLPLVQFVHLVVHLRRFPRLLTRWTAMQAVSALPLLGWVVVLSRREGQFFGIGWVPEVEIRDLIYTAINFTTGYSEPLSGLHWLGLGFALVLVFFAARASSQQPILRSLVFLWAVLPALLVFLISLRRPVYVDRFLIVSLPAWILLLAAGVGPLNGRWQLGAGLTLVGLSLWGWSSINLAPDRPLKEDWRQAFHQLALEERPEELLVMRVAQIAMPWQYYYHGELPVAALQVNQEMERLDDLAEGRSGVWLVYWNASASAHELASNSLFDPNKETDEIAAAWISGKNGWVSDRWDFPGVTLFHFIRPFDG